VSTRAVASDLARELAALVGEKNVSENPGETQSAPDRWEVDGWEPRLAVSPGTPEEVADVLCYCNANGLVVAPAGGCTTQSIGRVPSRVDVLLRTVRLRTVEHYDPGDLTIGIGAGTRLAEVHDKLAANRQVLPITVPQAERSTIGGVLARAAQDPRRLGYGAVRDVCIGIRFVTADGKIAKAGGRVVKNVAGYDLMKLMIGSYGTLGVIVGASFKLFPQPRQTRTFAAAFRELKDAFAFRDRILGSHLAPMCLELLSAGSQAVLKAAPPGSDSQWLVLLRAAGSDAVLGRYARELGDTVLAEIDGTDEGRLWDRVVGFSSAVVRRKPGTMLVRFSVPIAAVLQTAQACEQAAGAHGFDCAMVASVGVGTLQCAFFPVSESKADLSAYTKLLESARSELPRDGSAIVLACPNEIKKNDLDVWGPSPTDLDSMRAVKRALDEKDILNRGRFLF
jgi:glycolate oxidase FAD binding subunit